jgi:PhzF family phenazine biosynthesis protein
MLQEFVHVDVFSSVPYSGNSLAVFPDAGGLSTEPMLRITQELRHFESVFLERTGRANEVRVRVFDLLEELPFAGHPLVGAAAVLHRGRGAFGLQKWQMTLPGRTVQVTSERTAQGICGVLDQGAPEFLGAVDLRDEVARLFDLDGRDLLGDLPLEVVSTGLRYLVVPVTTDALRRARIRADISGFLRHVGAQFAVLLDEAALDVRHWTNDGALEDVATDSAAGVVGAYRLKHHLSRPGEAFVLQQGRFAGRPSTLRVQAQGTPERVASVEVGGDVSSSDGESWRCCHDPTLDHSRGASSQRRL